MTVQDNIHLCYCHFLRMEQISRRRQATVKLLSRKKERAQVRRMAIAFPMTKFTCLSLYILNVKESDNFNNSKCTYNDSN